LCLLDAENKCYMIEKQYSIRVPLSLHTLFTGKFSKNSTLSQTNIKVRLSSVGVLTGVDNVDGHSEGPSLRPRNLPDYTERAQTSSEVVLSAIQL
jgi:hypothetical protein